MSRKSVTVFVLLFLLVHGASLVAAAEPAQDFQISYTEEGGIVSVRLRNTSTEARMFRFEAKKLTNLDAGMVLKADKVGEPGATVPLLLLTKIDPTQPIQLEYSCTSEAPPVAAVAAVAAAPKAPIRTAFNPRFLYRLPFAPGESYLVFQGYFGAATHANSRSLDFGMAKGVAVHAMRGGRVRAAIGSFPDHEGGEEGAKRNRGRANVVRIDHADGTVGSYAHLEQNSVVVKVGQIVEAGDLLGRVGVTGYTWGPHLCVDVENSRGVRIPVLYATADNPEGIELKEGMTPKLPVEDRGTAGASVPLSGQTTAAR